MSFQKIVLIVAIIALILMLSVIGYMMYYSSQNQPFPPIEGTQRCPDGWTDAGANCTNAASSSGMFSNVGSFLTDVSCNISGASNSPNACINIVGLYDRICKSQWVQGNVTNGKDPSNCYLLASQGTTAIIHYGTATLTRDSGGSGYKTHTHTVTLTGNGYSTYPTVNLVITDGVINNVTVAAPQWVLATATDITERVLNVPQINNVGYGGTIKARVSSGTLNVSVNAGGSGYNIKIYQNVQLNHSSAGTAAIVYPVVNINVTSGVVTLVSPGSQAGLYADATTKMTTSTDIGGGSGFVVGLQNFAKTPSADIQITTPLQYTKQTLEKDVDWAKKYGITWDGYN
jgi:hypothetical protein